MSYTNRLPLYCQLAEIIEDKIDTGVWKKGMMIPSERELCTLYNMSRITVRNAIHELVQKGKLEKIQGKGTFVSDKSIIQNLGNVYSFSKEMEKQGKISSTKLVEKKIIKANLKIANALNIKENDEVIYIERLRCAEYTPIMLEKTYFSKDKYFFIWDIDLNTKPLYKTLEFEYGIVINDAIETFKACELNSYECRLLDCKTLHYGLLVNRKSYCNNEMVCYSSIVSKGDSFEFTVRLHS